MLIVDSKEPQKLITAFSKTGIAFKIEPLEVGDFSNDKGTFIAERKSLGDFWSSMADNRLLTQIKGMFEKYKGNRYIFVEINSLIDLCSIKPERYHNWIYSTFGIAENFGVHFREYLDYKDLIYKLNALDQNLGNKLVYRDRPKKLKGLDTPVKMLMQLGGIGEKKSKEMLKVCGSFDSVIKDLLDNNGKTLSTIKGIAPLPKGKILSQMIKEINKKYV